jgi:hypothetical protein
MSPSLEEFPSQVPRQLRKVENEIQFRKDGTVQGPGDDGLCY